MAKKPRARKAARVSHTDKVARYLKQHPGANYQQIAAALKLTVQQAYSIIYHLEKSGRIPKINRTSRKTKKSAEKTFSEADILAVKNIGLDMVKAIIKLLEKL